MQRMPCRTPRADLLLEKHDNDTPDDDNTCTIATINLVQINGALLRSFIQTLEASEATTEASLQTPDVNESSGFMVRYVEAEKSRFGGAKRQNGVIHSARKSILPDLYCPASLSTCPLKCLSKWLEFPSILFPTKLNENSVKISGTTKRPGRSTCTVRGID